jgi:Zn-dependent protease with chaperone function
MALAGALILAVLGTLLGILISYGVLLIILLVSPLFIWHLRRKATALIHGSGVHVSENQFPEIHRCVECFKARLGIKKEVQVYVIEANVANAMAVRYGKKNVILLTDDLIHGCLASGQPQALAFVIGHELAHIALDHNGTFVAWLAQHMKKLGRLNEYSADAVATALVGDRATAFQGLLLLTVGYALLPYVNMEGIVQQTREVTKDRYSKKAERTLSHPLALNRLQRILNAG